MLTKLYCGHEETQTLPLIKDSPTKEQEDKHYLFQWVSTIYNVVQELKH